MWQSEQSERLSLHRRRRVTWSPSLTIFKVFLYTIVCGFTVLLVFLLYNCLCTLCAKRMPPIRSSPRQNFRVFWIFWKTLHLQTSTRCFTQSEPNQCQNILWRVNINNFQKSWTLNSPSQRDTKMFIRCGVGMQHYHFFRSNPIPVQFFFCKSM